jgi:hypothetical protein
MGLRASGNGHALRLSEETSTTDLSPQRAALSWRFAIHPHFV